jgi:hypothetical protein
MKRKGRRRAKTVSILNIVTQVNTDSALKLDGIGTTPTRYPGGDTYHGEYKGGLRHGKGVYLYTNGDTYRGNFVNGVSEGYGEWLSERTQESYKGGWLKGMWHGAGIYTKGVSGNGVVRGDHLADGTTGGIVVRGYFLEGCLHGEGEKTWSNGDHYYGDFMEGKRHGNGTYRWNDQSRSVYKGQWHCDVMQGFGIITREHGSEHGSLIYEASSNRDCDSYSKSALTTSCKVPQSVASAIEELRRVPLDIGSCLLYRGHFSGGKPHRVGSGEYPIHSSPSGYKAVYSGSYLEGWPNGKGVLVIPMVPYVVATTTVTITTGSVTAYAPDTEKCIIYQGEFKNGMIHGNGTLRWNVPISFSPLPSVVSSATSSSTPPTKKIAIPSSSLLEYISKPQVHVISKVHKFGHLFHPEILRDLDMPGGLPVDMMAPVPPSHTIQTDHSSVGLGGFFHGTFSNGRPYQGLCASGNGWEQCDGYSDGLWYHDTLLGHVHWIDEEN